MREITFKKGIGKSLIFSALASKIITASGIMGEFSLDNVLEDVPKTTHFWFNQVFRKITPKGISRITEAVVENIPGINLDSNLGSWAYPMFKVVKNDDGGKYTYNFNSFFKISLLQHMISPISKGSCLKNMSLEELMTDRKHIVLTIQYLMQLLLFIGLHWKTNDKKIAIGYCGDLPIMITPTSLVALQMIRDVIVVRNDKIVENVFTKNIVVYKDKVYTLPFTFIFTTKQHYKILPYDINESVRYDFYEPIGSVKNIEPGEWTW